MSLTTVCSDCARGKGKKLYRCYDCAASFCKEHGQTKKDGGDTWIFWSSDCASDPSSVSEILTGIILLIVGITFLCWLCSPVARCDACDQKHRQKIKQRV